jgi:hypothetical protein
LRPYLGIFLLLFISSLFAESFSLRNWEKTPYLKPDTQLTQYALDQNQPDENLGPSVAQKITLHGFKDISLGVGDGLNIQQNLELDISGTLSDSSQIQGHLNDKQIPLQLEGNTATLAEIDQAWISWKKNFTNLILGDFSQKDTLLSLYNKRQNLRGFTHKYISTNTLFSEYIGQGRTQNQIVQHTLSSGNRNGYLLFKNNNIQRIRANTLRVRLDDRLLQENEDYQIDPILGMLNLTLKPQIHQNSQLDIQFESENLESQTQTWGASHSSRWNNFEWKGLYEQKKPTPLNALKLSNPEIQEKWVLPESIDNTIAQTFTWYTKIGPDHYQVKNPKLFKTNDTLYRLEFEENTTDSENSYIWKDSISTDGIRLGWFEWVGQGGRFKLKTTRPKQEAESQWLGAQIAWKHPQYFNISGELIRYSNLAQPNNTSNWNNFAHQIHFKSSEKLPLVYTFDMSSFGKNHLNPNLRITATDWVNKWDLLPNQFVTSLDSTFEIAHYTHKLSTPHLGHWEFWNSHLWTMTPHNQTTQLLQSRNMGGSIGSFESDINKHDAHFGSKLEWIHTQSDSLKAQLIKNTNEAYFSPLLHFYPALKNENFIKNNVDYYKSTELHPVHSIQGTRLLPSLRFSPLFAENNLTWIQSFESDYIRKTYQDKSTIDSLNRHQIVQNFNWTSPNIQTEILYRYFFKEDLSNTNQKFWESSWKQIINPNKKSFFYLDWDNNWQKGSETRKIRRYQLVPLGTGSVLFDSVQMAYIEGVERGNLRFVGWTDDPYTPAITTQNKTQKYNLELNPSLLDIQSGFLADIKSTTQLLWRSLDSLNTQSFLPPWNPNSSLLDGQRRISETLDWTPWTSAFWTFILVDEWSQGWGQVNSLELGNLKKINYQQKFGEEWILSHTFALEEKTRQNFSTWNTQTSSQNLSWKPTETWFFSLDHRFRIGKNQDLIATQNYYYWPQVIQEFKPKPQLSFMITYARPFSERKDILEQLQIPFWVSDGLAPGWSNRLEISSRGQIMQSLYWNISYLFWNDETNAPVFQRLQLNAKGVF